jgi:hypothetical protein
MSKTVTITITAEGPNPPTVQAAQGDWVVWVNPTSEWYSVWGFTGPVGSPQLFQQAGYGMEPWAAAGGEVVSNDFDVQYSYSCSAETGGIIIVQRPGDGSSMQQTTQKRAQGNGASSQASKALVTNGSRK